MSLADLLSSWYPEVANQPTLGNATKVHCLLPQKQVIAEPRIEGGLASAMQRQIERLRPSTASQTSGQFDHRAVRLELRPADSDSATLGLAKAVARRCVQELGVERSARPIAAVRLLGAGGHLSALPREGASELARPGHVLGAMPRS